MFAWMYIGSEVSLISPKKKTSAKSSPLFSRTPQAGVSNRRYTAREKYWDVHWQIILRSWQTVDLLDLEELAAAVQKNNMSDARAWLGKRIHTRFTKLWGSVSCAIHTLRRTWWTCRSAICWKYSPSQNWYAQIHSISYRLFLKISASRPRKNKEWPFRRLGPYFTTRAATPYVYIQIRSRNF